MKKLWHKFLIWVAKVLRSTWLFKWLDGYNEGMMSAIFGDSSDRYPAGSREEELAQWWRKAWKDVL